MFTSINISMAPLPRVLRAKIESSIPAAKLCDAGCDCGKCGPQLFTAELVEEIRDFITSAYSASSSICNNLVNFRQYLASLGVDPQIIKKSHAPEITKKHNEISQKRAEERAEKGDLFPQELNNLHIVMNRINNFMSLDLSKISEYGASYFIPIDLFIMNHCRANEQLTIDEAGKITSGLLKKRGTDYTADFVSFVSLETYKKYEERYNSINPQIRKCFDLQKTLYLQSKGLTTRDLRELGASLTLRHSMISGKIKCLTSINDEMTKILRHKKILDPADNYGNCRDPLIPLKAMIDECSHETIDRIKALVEADIKEKRDKYGVNVANS